MLKTEPYILERKDSNKIAMTVKEHGFCIVRNYFDVSNIEELQKEINGLYSIVPDGNTMQTIGNGHRLEKDCPAGKSLRIDKSSYDFLPVLKRLFVEDETLQEQVTEYYGPSCDRFLQIFSTMEVGSVDEEELGRHSWMHVDPYAAFKYATFLTKTTEETGALKVIPGSREEGKNIRENYISKTDDQGLNGGKPHRIIDFPSEMVTRSEDEGVFVECDLGDLVAIDTDIYHAGGKILDPDATRIAIYVHSRP